MRMYLHILFNLQSHRRRFPPDLLHDIHTCVFLGSGNGPIVTSLGNNVYVVWSDPSSGNWEILYRKSIDSGSTFDPTASNLSTNSGTSDAPAIAVS
jgi:hypothetical protein